jgi:hypothetical protein
MMTGDGNPLPSMLTSFTGFLDQKLHGVDTPPPVDGTALALTPEMVSLAKGVAQTNPQFGAMLNLLAPQLFAEAAAKDHPIDSKPM